MRDILQYNFLGILICIHTVIFLHTEMRYGSKLRMRLLTTAYCIGFLLIANCADMFSSLPDGNRTLRLVAESLTELAMVVSVYAFLLTVTDGRTPLFRNFDRIAIIPVHITAILLLVSAFTGVVFGVDANNAVVHGPLWLLPYAMCLVYLVMMLYAGAARGRDGESNTAYLLMLCSLVMTVTMMPYGDPGIHSLFGTAAALCTGLMFILLLSNRNNHDALTGCLNRRKFYIDARKPGLCAVIAIDLNGLKTINDTLGHAAGDKALSVVCNVISAVLPPQSLEIYRMGGDEFSVLCRGMNEREVGMLTVKIMNSLSGTGYSAAAGYGMHDRTAGLESTCSKADADMYKNKKKMRAGDNNRPGDF